MRYGATHRGFESLPLRHRPRHGLVDREGRGYRPSIDLRLRVSKPDRRDASLAGEPDRRRSRPVVSPTYAQGSYYGTNRVVAGAPGRLTGPATPLLSTTRAAQPPGGDPSRSGSSGVRTGHVSRKNGARGARRRRPPLARAAPKALPLSL